MRTLLDLFCGAGIGADGYTEAGFAPWGVDSEPQPNYPGPVGRWDALEVLGDDRHRFFVEHFDVIHASPPCQDHTAASEMRKKQGGTSRFGDLLTPTLALLRERWSHKIWVVENVPRSPGMDGAITLCGSMFGLQVQRHRLFLSNVELHAPRCDHSTFPPDPVTGRPRPWGVYHRPKDDIAVAFREGRATTSGGRTCMDADHARECMGVTRETSWAELKEGIPPAYTAYVGRQLIAYLEEKHG